MAEEKFERNFGKPRENLNDTSPSKATKDPSKQDPSANNTHQDLNASAGTVNGGDAINLNSNQLGIPADKKKEANNRSNIIDIVDLEQKRNALQ